MRLRATEGYEAMGLLASIFGVSILSLAGVKKTDDGKVDINSLLKTPGVMNNVLYSMQTLKDKHKDIQRLNELFFSRTKFYNTKEKAWYQFEYPGTDNTSAGFDEVFLGNTILAIEILVWEVSIEMGNFTRLFKQDAPA
jgi:hypothetical protein